MGNREWGLMRNPGRGINAAIGPLTFDVKGVNKFKRRI